MFSALSLLLAPAALIVGGAVGWLIAMRPLAAERSARAEAEAARAALDERFRAAITDLATMSERAAQTDALAAERDSLRSERETVAGRLTVAETRLEAEAMRAADAGAARVAAEAERDAARAEREAVAARLTSVEARLEGELRRLAEISEARAAAERDRDRMRSELSAAGARIASLEADNAAQEQVKAELLAAKEAMAAQFSEISGKLLGEAQRAFLERADQRFGESQTAQQEKLAALLQPVGDRLKSYEEQVGALEARRVDAFGQLHGMIEAMRVGQEQVRAEAARLGNSLRNAPKARGRWGERALQNVLEQCGLAEHTDFHLEQSMDTADGRLRPDAIVNVPGQKKLVIDAKVALNAYQAAFEADDDSERKRHLDLHARSMRNHVQALGSKSYQSQFDDAPDYVVMFVPGEHFVAAALEQDPDLWDFAFRNKVLLATPTNLVAIARTVAQVWRQDKLAAEAAEIGRMGAELYDRLATAAEHLKRVGGGLESAVNNYNKFVGSFERNVLSSGRRLAEKGVEIGKRTIEDVPLVESAPRHTQGGPVEPQPLAPPLAAE